MASVPRVNFWSVLLSSRPFLTQGCLRTQRGLQSRRRILSLHHHQVDPSFSPWVIIWLCPESCCSSAASVTAFIARAVGAVKGSWIFKVSLHLQSGAGRPSWEGSAVCFLREQAAPTLGASLSFFFQVTLGTKTCTPDTWLEVRASCVHETKANAKWGPRGKNAAKTHENSKLLSSVFSFLTCHDVLICYWMLFKIKNTDILAS